MDKLVGLAGWQVENLVARTTDLFLDASVDAATALEALVNEVERASHELQSEASLIFPPPELAVERRTLEKTGLRKTHTADPGRSSLAGSRR